MAAKIESVLSDYLKEIKKYSLLTAEEERDLAKRIRAKADAERRFAEGEISGTEYERIQVEAAQARDRMVQANLRLVISVAKNFRNRGVALEDLINEGNVGLMNAVDRFDPDVGSRFSTYASYWIDQAIRRCVQHSNQIVHIPGYLMEQIGRMRLAMRELEAKLGRPPSLTEIGDHLDVSPKKTRAILQAIHACSSRRQGTSTLDGDNAISESLEDTKTPAPFDSLFTESDAELVRRMLDQITDREAIILKLRFGLSGNREKRMTLKEIGARVGLTRERVRQIAREATAKLEAYLKENA